MSASTFCAIFTLLPLLAVAGPLAYGICQTGCNAGVVACYAAAGVTFGTFTAGFYSMRLLNCDITIFNELFDDMA